MKKKIIITLFTVIATSNHILCMEQNKNNRLQRLTKKNSKDLESTLKRKIVKQDDMEYNSIPGDLQYDLLKFFIADGNMQHLSLCLKYKCNPNRYHRKLSLLHYAIKKHKPEAITILSHHNADLIPLNKKNETPLDYAIALKYQYCIIPMVNAIEKRAHALLFSRKHCGLTKHILRPGPCNECFTALTWQIQYHSIYKPLHPNIRYDPLHPKPQYEPLHLNKQSTVNASSDAASDS